MYNFQKAAMSKRFFTKLGASNFAETICGPPAITGNIVANVIGESTLEYKYRDSFVYVQLYELALNFAVLDYNI